MLLEVHSLRSLTKGKSSVFHLLPYVVMARCNVSGGRIVPRKLEEAAFELIRVANDRGNLESLRKVSCRLVIIASYGRKSFG